MTNIYTSPSISGYNATPPTDDGVEEAQNEVTWDGIKTKIGDPLKAYADAISSAALSAFGSIYLNAVSAHSSDHTVVTGDRNKLLACSNTMTVTLLPAASAGSGFALAVRNAGTGVVTVDGDGAETINSITTYDLNPGDWITVVCDGAAWHGAVMADLRGNNVVHDGRLFSGSLNTDGTSLNLPTGWTATPVSTGVVDVNHQQSTADYIVVATAKSAGILNVTINAITSTHFTLYRDSEAIPADGLVYFIMIMD